MRKIRVMTVFGTRPEAVKMAPLVKKLEEDENVESILCVTAQHREMLDQVLEIFGLEPDYDLGIMKKGQTLKDITIRALDRLYSVYEEAKPDIVLVHGDTTTTFVGSLAAFYLKIKVGHVEAGLRTFNKYFPYPEEINRKITGVLADIHFAPTISNKRNLIAEGVKEEDIYITGNTVIDALKTTVKKDYVFKDSFLNKYSFENKRVIVVTAHRRENLGIPLQNICKALKRIANKYDDVEIVYPVHLNPAVKEVVENIIGQDPLIHLIRPVDVQDMHNLMDRAFFIMTDSGGLQEEAPSLGKPVLVLRNETERPEAIKAGTVKLVGTDENRVFESAKLLLENQKEYRRMAKAVNPYGDGRASERILQAILKYFGYSQQLPDEFSA